MFSLFVGLLAFVVFVTLSYVGQVKRAFVLAVGVLLLAWVVGVEGELALIQKISIIGLVVFVVLSEWISLRRALVSSVVMRIVSRILPKLGDTERIALEAGSVWFDGELFSGNPNWNTLFDFDVTPLSQAEQNFIDGPVATLCDMLDDWEINEAADLPDDVWTYLKDQKFFGMIIPESYGGLEFSALAHSMIVAKIASRSVAAAVTVMVPNSLGPAELLMQYGTQKQKDHYLSQLAVGKEIPCFALTEPGAGSDAASMQSVGIVCKGQFEGKEVTGIRLNWSKRYITLAPIATIIGLAFKLYDPDKLLSDRTDYGITCALLPRGIEGMSIGQKHNPMGVPFNNGPIEGKDVFIPIDYVIGGDDGLGQGWRMLMECLAVGRSISLPGLSVGAVQLSSRMAGSYATVREQFNMPIGKFEGVQEKLARIVGLTYLLDSARHVTCGAIDAGEHPSVVSAIVKAYATESMRIVVNDAMDIQAGASICKGPRNIMAHPYYSIPIGITVEGSNILTRSMIIYGQGAIRCHPYVQKEISAIEKGNLVEFDVAFWSHVGFFLGNMARAIVFSLTGGGTRYGQRSALINKYIRKLTRYSTACAVASDMAMLTLGGALKRKEMLSGRFADILGWSYFAATALKKYSDDGRTDEDKHIVTWACDYAIYHIEVALAELLQNFPGLISRSLLKLCICPLGLKRRMPSDGLNRQVADLMLFGGIKDQSYTSNIHVKQDDNSLANLETLADDAAEMLALKKDIRNALKSGVITPHYDPNNIFEQAIEYNIISKEDAERLQDYQTRQLDVWQVDAFGDVD